MKSVTPRVLVCIDVTALLVLHLPKNRSGKVLADLIMTRNRLRSFSSLIRVPIVLCAVPHENAAKVFYLAYQVTSLHDAEFNIRSGGGVGEGGHFHFFDFSNERNLTRFEIS